jgi:outer membrane protein
MRTIIKLLFPAVLTAALLFPASAQQNTSVPLKLTLEQAINYALENNANIKNAKIDLESAKKKIWETTAMGLPQVNATGSYQNIFKVPMVSFGKVPNYSPNFIDQNTPLTPAFYNNYPGNYIDGTLIPLGVQQNVTVNVTASQLIFSGEYIVGLQSARIFKELSEQSLTKSEYDMRESVSRSYFTVLILRENLNILKKSLDVTNQTLNDITAMNKQGFNEATDVDQMQLNKLNLENAIFTLDGQSRVSVRLLNFQLGVDLSQPIELLDSIGSFTASISAAALMNEPFNTNGNIDYKILQTSEHLNLMSLNREKSRYLPSINASFMHQELLNAPPLNFISPNTLSVSLSWQLFSSGMRNSRIQQARLALDKSTIAKNQVEQSLLLSYDQNHNNYITALNNYFRLKKNVELSDNIYQKYLIKFRQGIGTSLELTTAQNQYLSTQSAYYTAVLDLLNAKAALEKLYETAK